jgi:predicted dehydrogenase
VSCSYGPGRYDEDYEQKGIDYPVSFVRWTEKRNFEAILTSIANGKLRVDELITDQTNLSEYNKVYDNIGSSDSIASLLVYNQNPEAASSSVNVFSNEFTSSSSILGIIGAGNFTKMTMLPALKKANAQLKYIASSGGVTGTALAQKHGISVSTTDYQEILNDPEIGMVLITTRHNAHANMTLECLNAGKSVFVEKPLALNIEDLNKIIEAKKANKEQTVTVGFNRRFSPHIELIRKALGTNNEPININATMNAGFIPANVWVHDMEVGGGRIIGEACHYIDLCIYLTGSLVKEVCMNAMGENSDVNTDNASILLKFENGSNAVINYFANGAKSYSKERVEVYKQEQTWIMDNFRTTKGFGVKGFSDLKTKIDKGHQQQFRLLVDRLKNGGDVLIPFEEIINTTKASFAAIKSMQSNNWVKIEDIC